MWQLSSQACPTMTGDKNQAVSSFGFYVVSWIVDFIENPEKLCHKRKFQTEQAIYFMMLEFGCLKSWFWRFSFIRLFLGVKLWLAPLLAFSVFVSKPWNCLAESFVLLSSVPILICPLALDVSVQHLLH